MAMEFLMNLFLCKFYNIKLTAPNTNPHLHSQINTKFFCVFLHVDYLCPNVNE